MDNQKQQATTVVKKARRTDQERSTQSIKNRQAKGYKAFSMMLSPATQEMLNKIAEQKGLQKKQVIEQFIREGFENLNAA